MPESTSASRNLAGKYLTFILSGESYGIGVLKVREIIRHTTITTVPQVPDFIRGVINLRGKIIPVMDLRLKFGFTEVPGLEQTCTIVVQVKSPDGKTTMMGLIVDGVEEVTSIADGDIEETPEFGGLIRTSFIVGIAKVKGRVKALLDIDALIGTEGLKQLAALTA